MNDPRTIARRLASEAVTSGRPLDWFEHLYARASSEGVPIPWADRVPESTVRYVEADLFNAPSEWTAPFDVVLESYTLQVLPSGLRTAAIAKISEFVAPGGFVLFITRAREELDSPGAMPWPLTRREANGFVQNGFIEVYFEDYIDKENPPVRRFRACYQRAPA